MTLMLVVVIDMPALSMTMARMVAMKTKDKDNGDNEHDAATKTDMNGGVDEDNTHE